MNEKWFCMSVEEIEKKLKTNAVLGLSLKAARSRAQLHKKDDPFFTVKKKRIDKILLELFSDIFLVLLVLLAVFTLFFEGDAVIGGAILIVIAINLLLSFFVYYRDRRTLESMADFFAPSARVIRGGKLYVVDYRDLTEGDVIMIEKGDILGCDARLVQSDGLRVRMKVDKKLEKDLDKYAGTRVKEDELYAENMENIVHAGSTVLSGSGRAIVVAVGQYTYLGALTGGITELPSKNLPKGLENLKNEFSKMGMIMLLLTLPFCIFSVLFGNFPGGKVVLSESVLVALSFGATAMLSRASNLFINFYVRFIRRLAISENPCIIRSVDALDKLTDTDYLFLIDGSIATDGILHFDSLVTADGETRNLERMGRSATELSELITLYSQAQSSAPTIGTRAKSSFDIGISEFLEKSPVDSIALKIRCPIHSYLSGVDREAREIVAYTDQGVRSEISVSISPVTFEQCEFVMVAGAQKPLSTEGRASLKASYDSYVAIGRYPVLFSVDKGQGRCFVGMMMLREGADVSLSKAISALRRSGIRIVSFSNCVGRENAPEIPDQLRQGNRVYAHDLAVRGKDITYSFGSYDEYCGFGECDIEKLAKYAKEQNKSVAICGFTEYAASAVEYADVFISCSPVRSGVFGRFEEEIRSLEVPGEQSSASCTQTVKAEADILLMRPKDSRGGLEPLAVAMGYCRIAYRNLSAFLKYFVFAQIIRLVTIAVPMLFGQAIADARQILLLGFLMDFAAFVIFSTDMRRGKLRRKSGESEICGFSFYKIAKNNLQMLIPTLVGGALCLILPNLISLIGFFDNYIYKTEFTFIVTALLQICMLACVYVDDLFDKASLTRLLTNKIFLIEVLALVLFVVLCLMTPMGVLFGISGNSMIYLLAAFIPPAALLVSYAILTFPKLKGNTDNGSNKRKL